MLQLPVLVMLLLSVACIGIFLFVVEYVGKQLRPVTVVAKVAEEGLQVIRTVYPLRCPAVSTPLPASHLPIDGVSHVLPHTGRAGVVVAFNIDRLVALAAEHDCIVELLPQVGDFVASGDPLFRVYGSDPIGDDELRRSIALDRERTMEQDPAFSFRIIVDIADKALSPAINDPTTGVLAIDQIQHLLREVGEET